jgi:hypothetical protein
MAGRAHPDALLAVMQDHERFCIEALSVQDKAGRVVPMRLGPSQRRLAAAIAKQRAANKPARIICPKARQVWMSVGTAAHFFREVAFAPGRNAMVVAQRQDTALNLFSHYNRFHHTYRPVGGVIGLPPCRAIGGELEYDYGGDNKSRIQVGTAGATTIGRSWTIHALHLSEAAYYPDLRTTLAAAMAAVPKTRDTIVVVESTANGVGDEFHQMVQRAQDPRSGSEWEVVFFGWWEHPEYFLEVEDPERFEKSLSQYEKDLRLRFQLSNEQLRWRRYTIDSEFNGDEDLFKQEYPATIEEGFLSSGRPRFSLAHIERMPAIHDAARGGIELVHDGLQQRPYFAIRERGEMTVFRRPGVGRSYVIGADAAEGKDAAEGRGKADPDYGCLQVLDADTGEQVAVVRGRLTPGELGRYCGALATLYNMAFVVPEYNSVGAALIEALLGSGYPRTRIYHRPTEVQQHRDDRGELIGFRTTETTRLQLISALDEWIRSMSVQVHDPTTLQELRTFVIKPNGRAEHQKGCHDDTVFALALAIVGIVRRPREPELTTRDRLEIEMYRRRGEERFQGRGQLIRP